MPGDLIVSLEGPEMFYHNPGFESGHLYSSDKSLAFLSLPDLGLFSSVKWEWGNNMHQFPQWVVGVSQCGMLKAPLIKR